VDFQPVQEILKARVGQAVSLMVAGCKLADAGNHDQKIKKEFS